MTDNDTNIIYLGDKPFVKYITAAYMLVEDNDTILLKSRGKFTAKAIDLAEVMKVKFDMNIEAINTSSESFENKEGKQIRVSAIEIVMVKKQEDKE